MDFYFDAYNPETGQFEKMTADQVRAEQEFERQMEDIADSIEKDKTISEQLIEHLKSQGINVYDRAAMAEYNVPQISDRELSQKKTITLHRNGKDNTKKVHP